MIFVGADVHVRNSYLYATDLEGRRLAHGRRGNQLDEIVAFCEDLLRAAGGEVQPVRFVLESTTNSEPSNGFSGKPPPRRATWRWRPTFWMPGGCGSSPRAW